MKYKFKTISVEEIQIIKQLWEKLRCLHQQDTQYFKEFYSQFTFEERCKKFLELSREEIYIEVAMFQDIPIGYCISTCHESVGEIDSLYVEEPYRKLGIGRSFMSSAVAWLKEHDCMKIVLSVAEGHESVFAFYQKLGFYPRRTYLELKE